MSTKKSASTTTAPAEDKPLMHEIEKPVAFVSRKSFKIAATIPTGNYENLQPSMEIEYIIPEGADIPDNAQVMAELFTDLAVAVYPLVLQQTNALPLRPIKPGDDAVSATAASFASGSPLFKWLATVDRSSARELVLHRLAKATTPPPAQ